MGHSRASAILLSGHTLSPKSPLLHDLWYSIVDKREEVYGVANTLAKDLASSTSQPAVAYTKSLLLHPGQTIEENHLLDSRAIRILGKGKDAKEGATAFTERRKANFTDTFNDIADPWYPWVSSLFLISG